MTSRRIIKEPSPRVNEEIAGAKKIIGLEDRVVALVTFEVRLELLVSDLELVKPFVVLTGDGENLEDLPALGGDAVEERVHVLLPAGAADDRVELERDLGVGADPVDEVEVVAVGERGDAGEGAADVDACLGVAAVDGEGELVDDLEELERALVGCLLLDAHHQRPVGDDGGLEAEVLGELEQVVEIRAKEGLAAGEGDLVEEVRRREGADDLGGLRGLEAACVEARAAGIIVGREAELALEVARLDAHVVDGELGRSSCSSCRSCD